MFKGIGKLKNKCKIVVRNDVTPIVRPPRRVPMAIKGKLKETINNFEKRGIIQKATGNFELASNLVVVEKPNGLLRVCLESVDLNKAIKREHYLIPTIEEICTNLKGKDYFTVLNIKDGFYHVVLEKKSIALCTFSTPFGYYQFKRLSFGLSLAPELFQKINFKNFGDIEGVTVYFDDILIAGATFTEHKQIT